MKNKEQKTQQATKKKLWNPAKPESAIMLFELWQEAVAAGDVPSCARFEREFLEYCGSQIGGAHAPYNFLFMGFLGGLDMADRLRNL